MKNLILTLLVTFSSAVQGATFEKTSENIKINPSLVEQAIVFQNSGNQRVRITLVKVDNGGSSDTSSYTSPSRLVLGLHLDGEIFDIDANYEILDSLVSIAAPKYDPASKRIHLVITQRSETMKEFVTTVTVDLKDVLSEIEVAKSDGESTYQIKSSVRVDVK